MPNISILFNHSSPYCRKCVVGEIYAVGGVASYDESVSTLEIYDPAKKKWQMGEQISMMRWLILVFVLIWQPNSETVQYQLHSSWKHQTLFPFVKSYTFLSKNVSTPSLENLSSLKYIASDNINGFQTFFTGGNFRNTLLSPINIAIEHS